MSLLKRRRQICHQRIATALEQFDNGLIRATDPQLLAHHFQEAGELNAAFAYWIAAGDIAEQQGASQEAAAHYRSARQLTQRMDIPAADRTRLPELLMKLGNAQTQKAGYHSEDVLRIYQDAREAAVALDQQDEAAEAGIRMAPFLFGSCRYRDVMEIGNAILRGNQDRLRPETLVHVWVMLAGASCHMGEFQQSLACSEKAIELDDVVNCTHRAPWAAADPAVVARDYVEMSARLMGHFERSLSVAEQSMAIAWIGGHLFSIVWASVSRIFALRSFGRYAEALPVPIMLSRFARSMDLTRASATFLLHRGPVLFDMGDEGAGSGRPGTGCRFMAQDKRPLHARAQHDDACRLPNPGAATRAARISLGEAERLAGSDGGQGSLGGNHPAAWADLAERGSPWAGQAAAFEQAIARSRAQRARLFELHAARDLVSAMRRRRPPRRGT